MYNHVDFTQQSPVILSFCPGIRGIERGLERIFRAVRTCAYVEIEAFIVENLLAAMEEGLVDAAPIWTNLKTFNPKPFRGKVDGIIGGYPCQPFSLAGKREGENDPRHLWPFIREHVRTIQPGWCFFENVSGHLTLGFDVVKAELEEMGYFVEAGIYTAEEVGAPRRRERLFILAIRLSEVDNTSIGRCRQQEYEVCAGRDGADRTGETMEQTRQFVDAGSDDSLAYTAEQGLQEPRPSGIRELRKETGEGLDGGFELSSDELADPNNPRSTSSESRSISNRSEDDTRWEEQSFAESDRHCLELADTNDNRLDGTENGKSLVERGNGDETRQNEFQQSKRCGSDRTNEELADTRSARNQIRISRQKQRDERVSGEFNNNSTEHRFPAGQGIYQHSWEEPRTIESSLEYTINGYNFTEDLHRAIGNSVVEQTAELAFRDLWRKVSDWYQFVNG